MKGINKLSDPPEKPIPGPSPRFKVSHHGDQMQLGIWQLWRSLPRPCKFFLIICVVQAVVAGAFAARELARVRFFASL